MMMLEEVAHAVVDAAPAAGALEKVIALALRGQSSE